MGVITGGINLGAPILPATEEDIFPTHDAKYGKGGYRVVADITARNNIPTARREVGMAVKTLTPNTTWVLGAGLTNSDWTQEVMDGGTF